MEILRKIMRYSGMLVIKLQPKDEIDFKLIEGNKVDISDIVNKTSGRKDNNASRELPKSRSNKLKVKSEKKVTKNKKGFNKSFL